MCCGSRRDGTIPRAAQGVFRSTCPASTSSRTLSRRPRTCRLHGPGGHALLPVGQLSSAYNVTGVRDVGVKTLSRCPAVQLNSPAAIIGALCDAVRLVPDKIHPSAADARGNGADNSTNGVGDVVVGAGHMVNAVAAGARDPPLQADDLRDSLSWRGKVMLPELSNGNMSLNRSDLGCLHSRS